MGPDPIIKTDLMEVSLGIVCVVVVFSNHLKRLCKFTIILVSLILLTLDLTPNPSPKERGART